MLRRLSSLLTLAALFVSPVIAKEKNKHVLPTYVLHAQTVLVVIDPDAGEPVNQPQANAMARDSVEKALMEWGRFQLVPEGQQADLVISVRTGSGRMMQPTIKGGPIDQRPGYGQSTDSTIRIGGHQGQPPSQQDPTMTQPDRGPRMSNDIGPAEDMFAVYQGGIESPLDASPVWRYIAKDCLRAPRVAAVEEFRKAIAEAEKPQIPKKP